MNNYLRITFLTSCLAILGTSNGHEIRLYKESDHAVLRDMLANNKELLLPGNDVSIQVAKTEKYLNSKNYTTKVCVKNNKPVGFITYVKEGVVVPFFDMNDMKNFDPNKTVLNGAIQLFNVLEEHRCQGIGTALLTNALEDMKSKKIKVVIVQTKVGNAASRSLYEKAGFTLLVPIGPHVSPLLDCIYRLVN